MSRRTLQGRFLSLSSTLCLVDPALGSGVEPYADGHSRLQYSRYLATAAPPPAKKPRKKSTGKDTDAKSKQKTKNPPASEEPLGKRRSTMNSRSTYADEFVRTFAEEKLEESRSQSAHGAESVRGTGEDAKEERRKSREEGAGGSADTSWKKRSRDESVGE